MSHAHALTDFAGRAEPTNADSEVGEMSRRLREREMFSFRNDLGGLWLNESRLSPMIGRRFPLPLRARPLAHRPRCLYPRQRKFV